jgi:hypothetical protein
MTPERERKLRESIALTKSTLMSAREHWLTNGLFEAFEALDAERVETQKWVDRDYDSTERAENAEERLDAERAKVAALREALQQIAKGEGPFSRDPLTFASNVVQESINIARSALDTTP